MSKPSTRRRTQKRALAFISAGALVAGVLSAVPAATAAGDQNGAGFEPVTGATAASLKAGRYIVLLRAPSATGYTGGESGYSATRVAPGQQFDGLSANVQKYTNHLESSHNQLASKIGAKVQRHFTVATNGFVAQLTGKQAFSLSTNKDVLLVTEDVARKADTWNTPDALGLTGKRGAWARYAGSRIKAGSGVVVADLDTGIWPESKSFAGKKLTTRTKTKWNISRHGEDVRMDKADGGVFRGVCDEGQGWAASDCNTKLIGARYYPDAFLNVPEDERSPDEYLSTRDGDGHGTHTASTAAGNAVKATTEGIKFGEISGMAPGAKIAAYKVCFSDTDPDTGDCYGSSTLEAVDDAVLDGVDVINYSISGATDTVVDAVEYAFEGAAEAGIFVAASAGNSGPAASTVAHNSPWLTTVASATHTSFENTVVLGNGTKIKGASISKQALPQTKLVEASAVKLATADSDDAALCGPDTLDPAKVKGAIVLCSRGKYDRVAKSAEAKRAGAVGVILANVSPGSLDADFHAVPTIHISDTESPKVFSYIERKQSDATAAFKLGDTTGGKPTVVPQISSFSSRGPAVANDGDLLKPDIAAPGSSVLAAVAPPTNSGRKFDLYSGTSMSSPHIAGLAAFMMGVHPKWSPMQVKSAMMTTAKKLKRENGKALNDPFAQGAGQVNPRKFFNPGLFITSDARQWRGFLQAQGLDLGVEPLAAKDLNGPSMAQGEVVSSTTFTRVLTAAHRGRWKVSAHVKGFSAKTKGHLFFDGAGDTRKLKLKLTRTDAPLGKYSTGYVKLSGPTHLRIPVAVKPVAVKAPDTVSGEGTSGSVSVPVTAGFTGQLPIGEEGLAEADSAQATIPAGTAIAACYTVGADSDLARFDLDSASNEADMDLYVYKATDGCAALEYEAGVSATGSADESVSIVDPEAGDYYVQIDGYAAAPGEETIPFRFDFFDLGADDKLGALTAVPNPVPVRAGVQTEYEATWSGLEAGNRYLGFFTYEGVDSPTYIYVNS